MEPPYELTPLQTVDGVSYEVALTSRPWELPVDAVTISVGSGGLGGVGDDLARQFPDAAWAPIQLGTITPGSPVLLDLGVQTGSRPLRLVVVATSHPRRGRSAPTPASITTATAAAITKAAEAGATAIAVPLFAAGRLGVAPDVAAAALVRGALSAHPVLRHVVFFSNQGEHVTAIREQWHATAVPESKTRTGPVTSEPPAPAPPSVYSADQLAGGVAKDLVDPNEYIPLTRDHLGVGPYVSMLATVIAAEDTPLPLSIGVFGEWGSGKSYFMGLLRGQVKQLEGTPGHCAKIAQVGFNAWHYTDANLWASLGDEIFRQLAEPVRHPGEADAEHRARLAEGAKLRERLAAELEQRKQLTAVTQRAQAEAAALQRKIGEARKNRKTRALNLVRAVATSETLRAQYSGVWRKLGVDDLAEQGRLLADEIQGTRDEAGELRRISRYRQGKAVLAVAGVLLLAGACLVPFLPDIRAWLTGAGAAVCATLLAVGLKLVTAARTGLSRLRSLAEDIQGGLDDTAQREVIALRKADAERQIAERQLEEVVARIGELGRQLTELTPGRRLYAFLAERSRAADYHGNLGLISTIRKDFEKLVALMTAPAQGEARPLDRIVLYIDDLDRCSPHQVVDVLQAVHLLLAFDLFVVVVGVDPRWLLRSLSTHYDRLIEGDAVVPADGWHVTPEDYLEKILNIPLVLPRMPAGSLRQLLRGMVETPSAGSGERPPPERRAADFAAPDESPAGDIPVEAGSPVATQLDPAKPAELPRPLTEP
ncbi:P-loop NTPase fold protein, partial [Amycolatopsis sp.]|uniref:P-loop NTPase fold protein n=1 Tax=Amycolatopsis sp. TaxID=37632 RepID=UPI002D7E655D